MCTSSIGYTRHCIGLAVSQSMTHKNMALIRDSTRSHVPLGFSLLAPHACNRSTRRRTPANVITLRQQTRKHVHISHNHVIGWRHLLCNPICGPTRNQPKPCAVDFWLTVDFDLLGLTFALTFDQKSKFLKGLILPSFSHRFQFWTLVLHLKLQSWSIGAFFILWFLQGHSSRHLQVIFSCLSNIKPSSSFRLEFEGGYWRYIRPISLM